MKKLMVVMIGLAALGLSACKEEKQAKTETSEKVITPGGTEVETETRSDIEVDEQGRRTGTVDSKTTVDPEGMMNKETTQEIHQDVQ